MTAIAAYVDGEVDGRSCLDEIQRRLAPFGGDRSRLWWSAGAGLAVCQRHTLPEDVHDREPEAIDGVALAADVRLDNRLTLARTLGIEAAALPGVPDSMLVRRAWTRWGTSCTDHLVGEFAFIIWSVRERMLFAARDPIGARPLCYARIPRRLAVASVPAALVGLGGVSSALDAVRVAQRLAGAPPDPERSYFEGVSLLPAGHTMTAVGDRIEVSRYWTWGRRPVRYARPSEYVEHFGELFEAAVEARLRSSVPVAALLSGGLDSGAVTVTAARALGSVGGRVRAITWQPRPGDVVPVDGRVTDEVPLAASVSALHANIDHVVVTAPDVWVIDPLRAVAMAAGEPMRAMVNAAYFLATSQALGGRYSALLVGQFGNFSISYRGLDAGPRWLWSRMRQLMRRHRRADVTGALSPEFGRLYGEHLHDRPILRDSLAERRRLLQWNDPGLVNAALSAACGFDVRDPTADTSVVDYCLSIPDEEFRRGDDRRRLIRRAMRGRLPDATLNATPRGMQAADWPRFIVPYREEFRRLLADVERSPLASRAINVGEVRRVLDDWPTPRHGARLRYLDVLVRALSLGDFIVGWEERGRRAAID